MKILSQFCYSIGLLALPVASQYIEYASSDFNIKLNGSTQTLASLSPKVLPTFDFSPFNVLAERSQNGNHHTGDITLRYRVGTESWISVDSAIDQVPVTALTSSNTTDVFATSNLSPTLPQDIPLNITRTWATTSSGDLTLSFTLSNTADTSIEIGELGFPIEFNSIFTNRESTDTQANCSLTDPNIGYDGGYLRVTPLSGTGPALVVSPLENTPFEAWRFLPEDEDTILGYQSQTFEGFYAWEVFSLAWAENEWNASTPWNKPTSKTLSAGEEITVGLRFSLADSIRDIESTIQETNTPLVIGVPGFIIPQDLDASLKILYNSSSVSSITSVPDGAFTITTSESTTTTTTTTTSSYILTPSTATWGRVRLEIQYEDGKLQTVHYYITKAGPTALEDLGTFLTTSQYFNDTSDPFGRAPSVISYDRSIDDYVLQDPRVWIAGLSDEAGAGSWLAATMKQSAQPSALEISKLEEYIFETMWGILQQEDDYSVRKSVFFYQPDATNYAYSDDIDWSNWWSWDVADAFATDRAYDYVHVTAAYWAMYRASRAYPELTTRGNWTWYLNQAYQTVTYCMGGITTDSPNTGYQEVGLMGETVFGELLDDLKRENWTTQAADLEATMKFRAQLWDGQAVPYGSEMAWDSTGQEGVYYWTNYFGLSGTAEKTIDTILGYMPTVSHWAWNGNARRYWDNIYGGKLMRIERQCHHYGSGLNALPLLAQFEQTPTDIYLLRVGFGGNAGPTSNIDEEGFASASFHSWPETLAWDAYSGDYGPNFVGLVLGAGTYVVNDAEMGLVAFGGTVELQSDGMVNVVTKDAVRRKVFLAEYGLKLSVDAGAIESLSYGNDEVTVVVASSIVDLVDAPKAAAAILWIAKTAQVGSTGDVSVTGLDEERGGWKVDLSEGTTTVNVTLS